MSPTLAQNMLRFQSIRLSQKGTWSLLPPGLPTRPVFSTTALLLPFVALQFLMIGMVADGVIRRIAQTARAPVASKGLVRYDDGPADPPS